MLLELIASRHRDEIQPWTEGPVPVEHSVYGLHSISAAVENHEGTAKLLTETFGYRFAQEIGESLSFHGSGPTGTGQNDRSSLEAGDARGPDRCTTLPFAFRMMHSKVSGGRTLSASAIASARSWIGFIFALSIFGSQAACCSKSPPILRGLPRTKASTNSVRVCAYRRGWNKPARRSRECFQKSPHPPVLDRPLVFGRIFDL
jgi:hypothetical protein